jgi:hypothetical protein
MRHQQTELLDLINHHFSLSDLRQLCLDLSLDYEDLGGESKRVIIINLIQYLQRRGRLPELVQLCQELRSHVAWPAG